MNDKVSGVVRGTAVGWDRLTGSYWIEVDGPDPGLEPALYSALNVHEAHDDAVQTMWSAAKANTELLAASGLLRGYQFEWA